STDIATLQHLIQKRLIKTPVLRRRRIRGKRPSLETIRAFANGIYSGGSKGRTASACTSLSIPFLTIFQKTPGLLGAIWKRWLRWVFRSSPTGRMGRPAGG